MKPTMPLSRRTLLSSAAALLAGAAIDTVAPNVARRYFVIGNPERQVLGNLPVEQRAYVAAYGKWYTHVGNGLLVPVRRNEGIELPLYSPTYHAWLDLRPLGGSDFGSIVATFPGEYLLREAPTLQFHGERTQAVRLDFVGKIHGYRGVPA